MTGHRTGLLSGLKETTHAWYLEQRLAHGRLGKRELLLLLLAKHGSQLLSCALPANPSTAQEVSITVSILQRGNQASEKLCNLTEVPRPVRSGSKPRAVPLQRPCG